MDSSKYLYADQRHHQRDPDFEFFGDKDEGSFQRDDIKAATSTKWLRKLKTSFVRTPYNFNVYVYNGSEGKVTLGDLTIEPRDLDNVHKYAGVIDIGIVEKVIGKMPPDSDVSITALLIENEGNERLPLTPWILAHRVGSARRQRRSTNRRSRCQNARRFRSDTGRDHQDTRRATGGHGRAILKMDNQFQQEAADHL